MHVPLWLFVVALVWAVMVTVFWLVRNPLPFPDRGHRCFAVPNEQAAKAVVEILGKLAGLPERFTFEPEPTRQTLLWDNATVIIRHDDSNREQEIAPNGLSVVVNNPRRSAYEAAATLRRAGFTAEIKDDVMSKASGKLVVLTSSAFDGWVLVFRRHLLVMGKPPNRRKLLA
jgi:hypothetical protein